MSGAVSSSDQEIQNKLKQAAAEYAVQFVRPGMVVGLGTGSTAIFATRRIARLFAAGELNGIAGFATSIAVRQEAVRLGIPMMDESMPKSIDLTIDGADEVDAALNVIKGGGGALLREKIVAQSSSRVFIAVDESKKSARLGMRHALPVEVLAYGWRSQVRFLESAGARATVRCLPDGTQFATDSGNMILDCAFGPIGNPAQLAATLSARAGIVEHGLFIGLATDLIVAGESGIQHLQREV